MKNHTYPVPLQVEEWIAEQPASEQDAYRRLWQDTGKIPSLSPFSSEIEEERETAAAFAEISSILFKNQDGNNKATDDQYHTIRHSDSVTLKAADSSGISDNSVKNDPAAGNVIDIRTGANHTNKPAVNKNTPSHSSTSAEPPRQATRTGGTSASSNRIKPYFFWAAAAVLTIAVSFWYLLYINGDISVHAPNGQQISYVFSDGSSVDLNSGSTLHFSRNFASDQRRVTLQGEAFFEITGDDRPFLVETHNAMVRVSGTSFNIRARENSYDNQTSVILAKGGLEFIPRAKPDNSVVLKPGQFSKLKELSERPSDPLEAEIDSYIAWRSGGLFFNDEPLSQIFSEIERRFDARITVDHDLIKDQRFSLLYSRPESAERILRDICEENQLTMLITDTNTFQIN